MAAAEGDFPLSQTAGATAFSNSQSGLWDAIDAEFRSINASTSIRLASEEISTAEPLCSYCFVLADAHFCNAHNNASSTLFVKYILKSPWFLWFSGKPTND